MHKCQILPIRLEYPRTVAYVLALLAVALVGAGYLLGSRRGRSREDALNATLGERNEKLALVEHELLRQASIDPVSAVESLRSVNSKVTVLRISRGGRRASTTGAGAGAAGASAASCANGVPQYPHRRNLAGFSSPQDGHRTTSTSGEYLRTRPQPSHDCRDGRCP